MLSEVLEREIDEAFSYEICCRFQQNTFFNNFFTFLLLFVLLTREPDFRERRGRERGRDMSYMQHPKPRLFASKTRPYTLHQYLT